MAIKTKKALAQTVNAQVNPNITQRNGWKNCEKALAENTKTYASSTFTQEKYVQKYNTSSKTDKNGKKTTVKTPVYAYKKNHPWTLTAHEFNLGLPSNAVVSSLKFHVHMRVNGVKSVDVPQGAFCIYGSAHSSKYTSIKKGTGWENGIYYQQPNKKISSSWSTVTYTMNSSEIKKVGVDYSKFNNDVMGVDLRWHDAVFKSSNSSYSCNVDVAWVKVEVEYEVPEYKISYSVPSTLNNPIDVPSGDKLYITATYTQSTNGNDGTQRLKLNLPWGTELYGNPSASTGSSFNKDTMEWTVSANGKHSNTLDFCIIGYVRGVDNLSIGNGVVGTYPCYYQVSYGLTEGYDDIKLTLDGEVHYNHTSCMILAIEGFSYDDTITLDVSETDNLIDSVGWSIDSATSDVSINSVSEDNTQVVLNVPIEKRFTVYLRYCFIPKTVGILPFRIDADIDMYATMDIDVLDPYVYHINNNSSTPSNIQANLNEIIISNHRVLSTLDTDNIVIPIGVDEFDSSMIQSSCNVHAYKWEEMDYIGCVVLEQTHFDPKSTYKDKLLDNHYKNKRYMGKQLASDEDITLNVRLHPHDVTTIQGLIDMDKPIPINTNHKSFEGNSLNHRGWCEIYGITTTYTNPSWYKCDIDVKYLTHNLNTRFNIEKGNKVNTQEVTDMLVSVFDSGDPLSSGDDTLDYFKIDTDGTYMYLDDEVVYDEDTDTYETITIPDNQRNQFHLNNGQMVTVATRNTLSNKSELTFEWINSFIDEIKENDLRRIIRLRSGSEVVFEYEYADLEYESYGSTVDTIIANPIARIKHKGDWETLTEEVTLRTLLGTGESDDDEILTDEEELYLGSDLLYGSTLHFRLDNHHLYVTDEGFNSKEWSFDVELEGESYTWEVEFYNDISDAESDVLTCMFDFKVSNSIFDSQFADRYEKLIVSPFPVSNKKLLFAREAEEGSIYYYEDDNEEFSYLVEPYYQYHNGTDLVTDSGISIFNLNYGYRVVYMQNGLVRLGFDRLNGNMYLGRYDNILHDYVTTHNLKLSKYDDINIKSITDDKIEIQASDCVFTIWRGHPYIMVNHPTEDIDISSRFNSVLAESVGDSDYAEYPVVWNMMNDDNLLPSCIGGDNELNSSCVDVSEYTNPDPRNIDFTWSSTFDDITVGESKTFNIMNNPYSISQELDLNGGYGVFGKYSFDWDERDVISKFFLDSSNSVLQTGDNCLIYATLLNGNADGVVGETVYFFEEFEISSIRLNGDKSIMQSGDTVDFSASVRDTDGSIIKEKTVYFFEEVDEPIVSAISLTGDKQVLSYSDGDVCTLSASLTGTDITSGISVDFYMDSVKVGTGVTDSSGVATYNYTATGSGDVSFTASVGSILSEIYLVEDCYFANVSEITETQTSSSNVKHSREMFDTHLSLPSDFELSVKIKSTMTNNSRFGLFPYPSSDYISAGDTVSCQQTDTNAKGNHRQSSTSSNSSVGSVNLDGTVYHDWKLVKQGNVFKWFVDDVQLNSDVTLSWFDTTKTYALVLTYWQGGTFTIKDLKIKAL